MAISDRIREQTAITAPKPQGWITVAEAAIVAHVSPGVIYRWIRDGRLQTIPGPGWVKLVYGREVLGVESLKARRDTPSDPLAGVSSQASDSMRSDGGELREDVDLANRIALLHAIHGDPFGVVYYIAFGDRIKIGTTTDLKARMSALPHDEILAVEPGSNELEKRRHREFGEHRLRGEWFRDVAALREHASDLREEHGEPFEVFDREVARHRAFVAKVKRKLTA